MGVACRKVLRACERKLAASRRGLVGAAPPEMRRSIQ